MDAREGAARKGTLAGSQRHGLPVPHPTSRLRLTAGSRGGGSRGAGAACTARRRPCGCRRRCQPAQRKGSDYPNLLRTVCGGSRCRGAPGRGAARRSYSACAGLISQPPTQPTNLPRPSGLCKSGSAAPQALALSLLPAALPSPLLARPQRQLLGPQQLGQPPQCRRRCHGPAPLAPAARAAAASRSGQGQALPLLPRALQMKRTAARSPPLPPLPPAAAAACGWPPHWQLPPAAAAVHPPPAPADTRGRGAGGRGGAGVRAAAPAAAGRAAHRCRLGMRRRS